MVFLLKKDGGNPLIHLYIIFFIQISVYNIDSEYVAWNGNKSDKKLQGKYVVSWRDIPNRGMQMESKSRTNNLYDNST